MRWRTTHWEEVEDAEIRAWLYAQVEHGVYDHYSKNGPTRLWWAPTKHKIADLADATGAVTLLSESVNPPAWLDGTGCEPAGGLIACTNGILVLDDRVVVEHNPRHFTLVSVPFGFHPDAPTPERWLRFLKELWPDDEDQIAAVQEWFGYVISGRTDLQKILMLVGPTRAGKGVIGRILTALIGAANVSGPTLSSLATNFGLQDLLGKPLAIISDARLGRGDVHIVVERLLSVSGEDTLTVDRKYRDPWTGRLPTRFVLMTNELPRLGDSSAAIAHRFVPLVLSNSFLGSEDRNLTKDLLKELPGILVWALEGLDRLVEAGRFTESNASIEAIVTLQDLASPIAAFLRERTTTGGDVDVDILWTAWKDWCESNGQHAGTKQVFGRNLRSRIPRLRTEQRRDQSGGRARRYIGLTLKDHDQS
jgi:putative DNA primase/helicase